MKKTGIRISHFWILVLAVTLILTQSAFASANQSKAPVTAGGVEIKSWYIHYWSLITSPYSCRAPESGCWANPNYFVQSWLMSQHSVRIETGWTKPALVYWTKYISAQDVTFCYVEVQEDGSTKWDRVKSIGGTSKYWHQEMVDLKAYSGKSISVKFYCEPNYAFDSSERHAESFNKQILYVQGVTIVPDSTNP